MDFDSSGDEARLCAVLSECHLASSFAAPLNRFLHYLLQANKQLNLMSRKLSVADVIDDHFADCLVGAAYFAPYADIADLGTGGGLPGLLLALVYPDKHFDLFDKSVRKCEYLQKAKSDLAIQNVDVHNALINEAKIKNEVITCRAFKPIVEIIDMTVGFFNGGGRYILYKGRTDTINEELSAASRKYHIESKIEPLYSRTDKQRSMVILHKAKS